MAVLNPDRFISALNIDSMANQFPELGILTLGVMLSMLTGGIDLSVVGIANLTGASWRPTTTTTENGPSESWGWGSRRPRRGGGCRNRCGPHPPNIDHSGRRAEPSSTGPRPRLGSRPQRDPWRGQDSNLRRQCQSVYSRSPLTAREPRRDASSIAISLTRPTAADGRKPPQTRRTLGRPAAICRRHRRSQLGSTTVVRRLPTRRANHNALR